MDNSGGPSRSDQLDLMLTYEQQAHARTKAALATAQAELSHERLRYDGMRSDRDDWRKRHEDEQAAHALTAERYVESNRALKAAQAERDKWHREYADTKAAAEAAMRQLTEARRVLRAYREAVIARKGQGR